MTCYVLDTDHLSLYERNHPQVCQQILLSRQRSTDQLMTTIVVAEEQCIGRLAQIHKAKTPESIIACYGRLKATLELFSELDILAYCDRADAHFREFLRVKVRIGTQDLRIAAITMANQGVLLTRNRRDFEKVPGLRIEDWSI